jgi:hypothetical protein
LPGSLCFSNARRSEDEIGLERCAGVVMQPLVFRYCTTVPIRSRM